MNKKIVIFGMLVLGIVFLSGCSQGGDNAIKSDVKASVNNLPKAEKIEVINFHATQRCVSCSTLGNYSEATIYEFFQPELRDGIVSFQSVNVDLPENRELAKKYQAVGSSLFINVIYDGKDHIEEDTRVWRLLSSEAQFKSYLKDKVDTLLNK